MGSLVLAILLAQGAPIAAPVVPDVELATQRGGFQLPNGIDIALTVQTQTSLNGAVVLRSEFRADSGMPTLTVYAPNRGESVETPTAAGSASVPTISYDSRGLLVLPGASMPAVTVGKLASDVPAGLQEVADGTSVVTDAGVVSRAVSDGLQSAELRSADLTITHLAGTAFGSAVANSGSDRSIDTQTALSIDLRNAGPDVLGSAMLRVENVALDALRSR